MEKSEIQKQIKKNGLSMEMAAEKLGVSRTTLYNYFDQWQAGQLSLGLIDTFLSNFKFDDKFLKIVQDERKNRTFDSPNFLMDVMVHEGGMGTEGKYFDGSLDDTKATINLLTKGLAKSRYRILTVESDYMAPAINSGDIAVIEFVDPKFFFKPHDYFIYLVNANNETYLARILKQENNWLLKMDNVPDPVIFNPTDISGLYLVRRVFQSQDAAPKMFTVPS